MKMNGTAGEGLGLIPQLNKDLRSFIRKSIELSDDVETWSYLPDKFDAVRCREIRKCRKRKCPSYKSDDYRCWLKVGSFAGNGVDPVPAKRHETCFDCEVFQLISKDPLRYLYENINTIIFHFQNRVARLREQAVKDQLTGLYNRHLFNEIIEREVARGERNKEVVSFVMLDMDNLKQINDRLGHLTGDRMLAEGASLIRNTVRKCDIVFRFGGDEFLVLLVNADCNRTAYMVDRLIASIDRWNEDNAVSYGCRLSFSIGCATCNKCAKIIKTLNEADARMYQNKKTKNKKPVLIGKSFRTDILH